MPEAHLVDYGLYGRPVLTYLEPSARNPVNPDPAQGHTVTGQQTAQEIVDDLSGRGLDVRALACDITQKGDIELLFDRTGPVDILVNNAAYCRFPDTLSAFDREVAERTFAVNAVGTAAVSAVFVSRFVAAKGTDGRIINISTGTSQSFAHQVAYGASKAAVEALTRSMAIEAGPLGITVNAVAPGPVQTGYIGKDDEQRLAGDIPLGRIDAPDDIAHTVAFLGSRQAGWITGQILRVSGGHEI